MKLSKNQKYAVGAIASVAAVVGTYFIFRTPPGVTPAAPKPVEPPKGPLQPDPYTVPDIANAMPTLEDFPMGWEVIDSGYGADATKGYSWRLLELGSPSDKCGPTPCTYVVVFKGAAPTKFHSGWQPTRSADSAYEILESRISEYS